ncbi:MAG: M48 family metallopeptidase [Leptolyngbya sp. SIO1E4]|nr:M48 family metallopeptidase [Leptolyngbya sp. SIO1E4]
MQQWITQLRQQKVSTPEEFDALVKKIEIVAHRNPTYYRTRLKLLACLGYAYILAVFILLVVALWGTQQILIYTQGYDSIGQLNGVIWLMAIGFLSMFFVRFKAPAGIPLTRKQVPQLFTMLDELSSALKAPRLDKVILNEELNAAIMQRPRYGFIGWQTNYLLIGLPLMQALSPEQCKAVLAHELAHLCGDDGRTSAWIYRIRQTWYELAEKFEQSGQGNFLFKRFFSWYGPFFRAYSFVHARAQEYEADRRAAELVGAEHKAEALIWLNVNSTLLHKQFWPEFQRQSKNLKEPPDNFISQCLDVLRSPIAPEQSRRWLALRLTRQTNNDSTHPCLADRLEALGYIVPDPLEPPTERATALLGRQLDDLTEQLNQLWKQEEADGWEDYYQLNQHQLDRLNSLNSKAEHLLTVEEKIKRAAATWQLQHKQTALSLFQAVIEDVPEHAVARYWVGFLLLTEQQNEEGVPHLQFAMDHDPSLVIPACRQLYSFYLKRDQPTSAEPYQQRWQRHAKIWDLAQTEREKFDLKTRFVPHDLPVSEIQQLVECFSKYPQIKAVYLARKVVERFPEYSYYVFVITRRSYRGMGKDYKNDYQLKLLIKSAIAFSGDYTLRFLSQQEQWKQLTQLEESLIYHRSN